MAAKVSKDQFKQIVRECLLEILSEGLGAPAASALRESRPVSRPVPKQQKVVEPDTKQNFTRAVKQASTMLTSDPILQTILEDTARTTYQDQVGADKPTRSEALSGGSKVDQTETAPRDLTAAFGGQAAKKWADLAFAPSKSRLPLPQ